MQQKRRYHSLAKERTILLRCENLEPPCLSWVKPGKTHLEQTLSALLPLADRFADIPSHQLRATSGPGDDGRQLQPFGAPLRLTPIPHQWNDRPFTRDTEKCARIVSAKRARNFFRVGGRAWPTPLAA
jgi:hypothetical protein